MFLKVIGCPDRKFKKYVIKAVNFFSKKLIRNTILHNNLDVTIKFDKTLQAFALSSVDGYNDWGKPRDFLIEVHPGIGAAKIFEALAHEMVHIKQYACGETNASLSKWKGVEVDVEKIDYWSQPWELEAYGYEEGLYNKFINEEELWNVFKDVSNPNTKIRHKKIRWKL